MIKAKQKKKAKKRRNREIFREAKIQSDVEAQWNQSLLVNSITEERFYKNMSEEAQENFQERRYEVMRASILDKLKIFHTFMAQILNRKPILIMNPPMPSYLKSDFYYPILNVWGRQISELSKSELSKPAFLDHFKLEIKVYQDISYSILGDVEFMAFATIGSQEVLNLNVSILVDDLKLCPESKTTLTMDRDVETNFYQGNKFLIWFQIFYNPPELFHNCRTQMTCLQLYNFECEKDKNDENIVFALDVFDQIQKIQKYQVQRIHDSQVQKIAHDFLSRLKWFHNNFCTTLQPNILHYISQYIF